MGALKWKNEKFVVAGTNIIVFGRETASLLEISCYADSLVV